MHTGGKPGIQDFGWYFRRWPRADNVAGNGRCYPSQRVEWPGFSVAYKGLDGPETGHVNVNDFARFGRILLGDKGIEAAVYDRTTPPSVFAPHEFRSQSLQLDFPHTLEGCLATCHHRQDSPGLEVKR